MLSSRRLAVLSVIAAIGGAMASCSQAESAVTASVDAGAAYSFTATGSLSGFGAAEGRAFIEESDVFAGVRWPVTTIVMPEIAGICERVQRPDAFPAARSRSLVAVLNYERAWDNKTTIGSFAIVAPRSLASTDKGIVRPAAAGSGEILPEATAVVWISKADPICGSDIGNAEVVATGGRLILNGIIGGENGSVSGRATIELPGGTLKGQWMGLHCSTGDAGVGCTRDAGVEASVDARD